VGSPKRKAGRPPTGRQRAVRASVSLSPETYRTIEALAKQKRVSTSWVLRDAAEQYVAAQWPLLNLPAK
jgi:Ribbon-helix-helix protein, copG family